MKKLLSVLIGLVLILSMVSVVAGANSITPSTEQNGETRVIFKISQDYSVTIPAEIELNSGSGTGYGDLKVDIDQIGESMYLNVIVSGDSGYYNTTSKRWIMKLLGSSNTDENKIEYIVGVGRTASDHVNPDANGYSPIRLDSSCNGIVSVSANHKDPHEVKIHCKIPNFNPDSIAGHAGNYEGKLVFTVSVDSNAIALGSGYVFEATGFYSPTNTDSLTSYPSGASA